MRRTPEIRSCDSAGIPLVAPLWEALFDHHLAIGAAGLATVARADTWPLRRQHYEALVTDHPDATFWLAYVDGSPANTSGATAVDIPVGYAMAYRTVLDGEPVMLLETLSVLPSARGHGIGTLLMAAVDSAQHSAGIAAAAVDVMAHNERARALYLRRGYVPHSHTWMRSNRPERPPFDRHYPTAPADPAAFAGAAAELGLDLTTYAGPDDTWDSADTIIVLTTRTSAWPSSAAPATDPTRLTALDALCARLEAAGLWSIQITFPATPASRSLSAHLCDRGFRLCTERLARALGTAG